MHQDMRAIVLPWRAIATPPDQVFAPLMTCGRLAMNGTQRLAAGIRGGAVPGLCRPQQFVERFHPNRYEGDRDDEHMRVLRRNAAAGNVFADLDLPEADTHLLKAELVSVIDAIIRRRSTTQAKAAHALGLSQPELSRLLRGDFREYSLEHLLRFLMAFGCDIDIVIRPSGSDTGGTLRVAAPELD